MQKHIKFLYNLLLLLIFISFSLITLVPKIKRSFGLEPVPIKISGTGSMHPTFPKGTGSTDQELANQVVSIPYMYPYPNGISVGKYSFLNNTIGFKDIVSFENSSTRAITSQKYDQPSGFVKRIVGLPGDLLEFRDGLIYRNNQVLYEPYTAKARSTFGSDQFPECKPFTVPQSSVFVLGDNRTASNDSRYDLGFVPIADIDHLLPFKNQVGTLDSTWRDPSRDLDSSNIIKPDEGTYVSLLNAMRQTKLTLKSSLIRSAEASGQALLQKRSLDLKTSLSQAGYSNITYAEIRIQGHYAAEEVLENQLEFPNIKKIILDSKYQDIGISTVNGLSDNCPTQFTIIHLGGYIPPNYSKEIISSWQTTLSNLQQSKSIIQSLPNTQEIIDLMSTRISRIEAIVSRITKNQWLTSEEEIWAKEDSNLANKQFELISKLKGKID